MTSALLLLVLACAPNQEPPADPTEVPSTSSIDGLRTPVEGLIVDLVPGSESVIRLRWMQASPMDAHIEFQVNGGAWQQTPTSLAKAGLVTRYILGVPYDTQVTHRVVVTREADSWVTPETTTQTSPLPGFLPVPQVLVAMPALWDASMPYVLASIHQDSIDWDSTWWVFIVDRQGNVVWSRESRDKRMGLDWVSRHITVRHEGDALLIDRATAWTSFDDGAASTVVAMTLDGNIEHTYQTPGLHHPFTSLPDGVIAWGARIGEQGHSESIELVDLDGHQERVWSCADFHQLFSELEDEICGSNTLWWDATTDRFLFSFWSTENIVEIDRASGELIRWFGQGPDAWAFSPQESAFWWQHGPSFTPEGTLLVSSKATERSQETVVREYALDEDTETLVEVWSAGEDREVYAKYGGDAHRLPNGNTLHGYGSAGHLVEFTPSGTVAWELSWSGSRRIGQTTPLADLYALLP